MVEYLNLKRVTAMHQDEIMEAVAQVVDSGWYLQGEANARFESEYAAYIGTRHCIGCANGLDALTLILRAYRQMGVMSEGDEVIVPANTYIASILAISENGMTPVLVEPHPDTLQIDERLIERAITSRTRAVMIVHLYGHNAWTPAIEAICRRHDLRLIEDNAQAQGCFNSKFKIQNSQLAQAAEHMSPERMASLPPNGERRGEAVRTGSLGHAAAHSFYPGKNLGALGDGGAVTTNDDELAAMVRTMGNYGSSEKYVFPYRGRNSRLDEIQAAVLSVRLRYLDDDNERRNEIAGRYHEAIANPLVSLPYATEEPGRDSDRKAERGRGYSNVYHIFPVFCDYRDELQAYLRRQGIGTMIHYPIPPHHQTCYREWSRLSLPITERIHLTELSLPCNQAMTDAEVEEVCEAINRFSV